jgi:hypothetical protein
MVEWTRAARTKILFAVAGGGAAVAMAGFVVAVDDGALPDSPPVASPVMPGPMTQGETVTTTIAPTVLATEKAAPTVKAKRFGE